jgi:hypothetical protein
MKKILLFIALFCTVGLVRADEILTAQPGAYYRVEVQQGTQRALGSPFQYFSSSLEEIFKNQLVGAPQDANATKVIKWVNSSQSYLQAFLADGTGDTSKDKKYFNNSSDWVPTTLTLSQGEGFFLQAPQTLTVYITGKIVLDSTVSVTFAPQFTLFSLPFSSCQGINSTSFGPVANGAATEADSPDVISTINPAQSFWLCNPGDSSAPEYLKWMDASAGTISSQTLLPTEAALHVLYSHGNTPR